MIIEILKLISSFLTPMIVLIFGLRFNKILEASKAENLKKQNWQETWAKRFLDVAFDYNTGVSEIVSNLFQLQYCIESKDSKKLDRHSEKISILIEKLQYSNWDIQNFTQFAPLKGKEVNTKGQLLNDLIAELLKNKKGSLEEIRKVQFEFNDAIKHAHAEILEIDNNKKLK